MRILLVHHKAGFQGGAEANIWQVARAFRERGQEVGLLHGSPAEEHQIDEFLEPFSFAGRYRKGGFSKALATALRWRPEVVYVHKLSSLSALEQLVASGIPLVRMVHDHDMYCQRSSRYFPWSREVCTKKAGYGCLATCGLVRNREGRLPFKLEWPGRKLRELGICRKFSTHIVQTDYMRSELLLHDFNPDGIRVLPVAPRQDASFVKTDYAAKGVLFVGQILRGKGLDFLIRALHRIRDMAWDGVVAGDGPHRAACESLSRELGLEERLRFAGRLGRSELLEACRNSRVGVVPSVWPEPMGMVGLEFMWAGLPVVGFDAGGISHWLEDGKTGVLVPARDTEALAEGMARMLDSEELAARMGREARAVAEQKYRHEDYVERLLEILFKAARGASASEPASVLINP